MFNNKSKKFDTISSILSSGCNVIGNIISTGNLEIFGTIDGTILGDIINIREGAKIKGIIKCNYLKISGNFDGEIEVKFLHIAKSASINGKIKYSLLVTEEHAVIDGTIIYVPDITLDKDHEV